MNQLKQIETALIQDNVAWQEFRPETEGEKPVREYIFNPQMALQGWVQITSFDPLVEYSRTTYQLKRSKKDEPVLRIRNEEFDLELVVISLTHERIEATLTGETLVVLVARSTLEGASYPFSEGE